MSDSNTDSTGKTVPTAEDTLARLAEFKRARGTSFCLQSLGLFGSVARGTATAQSDIDVVFRMQNPDLLAAVRLKDELEGLLGRPVDVIRLRDLMNPRLKDRIEREAIYV